MVMRRIDESELMQIFLDRTYPEPNTGCWLWGGQYNDGGYGVFKLVAFPFKTKLAHRCSYFLHYGPFDHDKLKVCHKCDNPACVNPEHLFIGTQQDNVIDMYTKGRSPRIGPRGESAPHAKLTEKKVAKIRSLKGKKNQYEIAEMFGVAQSSISFIMSGKTWKHI